MELKNAINSIPLERVEFLPHLKVGVSFDKEDKKEGSWYSVETQLKMSEIDMFENKLSSLLKCQDQLEKYASGLLDKATEIDRSFRAGRVNPEKIIKLVEFSDNDQNNDRDIKRKCILSLMPMIQSGDKKAMNWWAEENPKTIEKTTSSIIDIAFNKLSESEKLDIDNFDILIFDADKILWDGAIAMMVEPPYKKISEDEIEDKNGKIIKLKPGIKDLLRKLRGMGKSIGLVSKSEKDNINFEDQPILQLLKLFGIFSLFNEMIVITRDLPKSIFIPEGKRVLFIDDDIRNLEDVSEHTKAKTTNNIEKIVKDLNKVASKTGTCPICKRKNVHLQEDHKIPMWKGGPEKRDGNKQYICEKCHKNKTKGEGSFQEGGKDRHRKLKKQKSEDGYIQYQTDAGKAKIDKERKEIGEKAFSKKQRERANKRWHHKASNIHVLNYIKKANSITSNIKLAEIKSDNSYYNVFLTRVPIFFRYTVDQKAEKELNLGKDISPTEISYSVADNELKDALLAFLEEINHTQDSECPNRELLNTYFPVPSESTGHLFPERDYVGETKTIAPIFMSSSGTSALQKLTNC